MTSFIGGGGDDEFRPDVPEPASQDDIARLKASMVAFVLQELGARTRRSWSFSGAWLRWTAGRWPSAASSVAQCLRT
jgi:hypothetical protein